MVLKQLRRSMQNCKRLSTYVCEFPGMHEIMGNMLCSLYTCPSGLLWRRRWKLGVTLTDFFSGQIPWSLGSTTYRGFMSEEWLRQNMCSMSSAVEFNPSAQGI
jgi:hypothetical protein